MFPNINPTTIRRLSKSLVIWSLALSVMILLPSCGQKSVYRAGGKGFWYTFQKGDTLEKVAARYSLEPLKLRKQNDIYDPGDLRSGIRIFIPGIQKIDLKKGDQREKSVARKLSRFVWPAQGVISSGFGKRHGRMHQGIDITKDGGRNIVAVKSGKVVFSGRKNGYGNTIIIDHGQRIKTLYAHNQTLYVKRNEWVRQGTRIAKMGSTGKSSGIHLHFEIIINEKHQNPLRYLPIR